MSQVFESLGDLLSGRVEIKSNRNNSSRSRMSNVSSRAPEVMVKVTGFTKGGKHMMSHLDYISRNGKVDIETETGEVLKGKNSVRAMQKDWVKRDGKRTENTRDTTNIILSMPKGTNPQSVKNAARRFAKDTFSENYQYVFALHEDTDSPHVHLTIKNFGFDRKRLQVKKGDPQIWREGFAKELRREGVEAEATSRSSRGVIKKGISQVIKHIRDKGFTPRVDEARVRDILEEIRQEQKGVKASPKEWEKKIVEKQTEVRKTWLGVARELLKTNNPEDSKLSNSILNFVNTMPPIKTVNHEVKEGLVQAIKQKKKQVNVEQKPVNEREEER